MCLPPHDTWCWVIDDKGVLTINEKQCLTFSPQNFDITINGISIENGVQNSSIESEELDGIIEISRKK